MVWNHHFDCRKNLIHGERKRAIEFRNNSCIPQSSYNKNRLLVCKKKWFTFKVHQTTIQKWQPHYTSPVESQQIKAVLLRTLEVRRKRTKARSQQRHTKVQKVTALQQMETVWCQNCYAVHAIAKKVAFTTAFHTVHGANHLTLMHQSELRSKHSNISSLSQTTMREIINSRVRALGRRTRVTSPIIEQQLLTESTHNNLCNSIKIQVRHTSTIHVVVISALRQHQPRSWHQLTPTRTVSERTAERWNEWTLNYKFAGRQAHDFTSRISGKRRPQSKKLSLLMLLLDTRLLFNPAATRQH